MGGYRTSADSVASDNSAKCKDRWFIVTGGNSGIGLFTVLALARHGAHVVVGARDQAKTERVCANISADPTVKTSGGTVEGLALDLGSNDSVRAFAENFRKMNRPLHGLVNNAGVMLLPYSVNNAGIETVVAINHCGPYLLTTLLMDLLIASKPSRVVNVSSALYKSGNKALDIGTFRSTAATYNKMVAYQQSKLANVLFSYEINKRFGDRGVTSFALHPGVIGTDLVREVSCGCLLKLPCCLVCMKTPSQGASTTLQCLLTDVVPNNENFYYANCKSEAVVKKLVNAEDAQKLWEWSEANVSGNEEKKEDGGQVKV